MIRGKVRMKERKKDVLSIGEMELIADARYAST